MKRKLTGDSQQFYQYQQNEQSPLTSNCKKRQWHMKLEIQVSDRHKNVARLY